MKILFKHKDMSDHTAYDILYKAIRGKEDVADVSIDNSPEVYRVHIHHYDDDCIHIEVMNSKREFVISAKSDIYDY